MKTKAFLITLLVSMMLSRAGASLADEQKLAAANNIFAFKLLKQIADEQPTQNVFISPYSASTALQMVANGAAGQTKMEMQKVLATDTANTGLSDTGLNQANKEIAQSLHEGNASVILEIANGIWYHQSAKVNPDFLKCNRDYFDATVAPLNFADSHSVDIINDWASEKTHGRIPHIVDHLDPESGRLFLANAVYFKGKWSDPFDPRATHDQPFYLRDGSQKTVSMMGKSGTFTYRRGTGYQAVRLPYQGENLAMYVFLPDANSSPEKLLSIMKGDTWQKITKPGFANEDGDLELPKFKLEYSKELTSPLQQLGMKTAFAPDKANFSGMSPEPLYISGVVQNTFVEVKEDGTEAAAVTGVSAIASAMPVTPPQRFEMIVDHPFLFLIEDSNTGTILFMGIIYDPPADK
jgi:serine protease inhibitor